MTGEADRPLRDELRARRRSLDPDLQDENASRAAARAIELPELRAASAAGLYVADDGELDPGPLAAALRQSGVALFLPIATADGGLEFAVWAEGGRLGTDRWGIPRPDDGADRRPIRALDVVVVPLVAVDRHGTRLGRGAGFYDRALAHRLAEPAPPFVLGYGHELQRVETALDRRPWDVPLDALVTESTVLRWPGPV